jgi:uncharacterized protein YprB with RNaseH-like and TPR domain/predicted RNA-binding Zn-ribbon protein involved in translation (DUF1610 family)
MKAPKTKVLFFDIETSPLLGYSWRMHDSSLLKVIDSRRVLSVAWKWQGKSVEVCSLRTHTEQQLLQVIYEQLEAADVVVSHNGDKFDHRVLSASFVKYGFQPIKPPVSVDTLKAARTYFSFTSNRLGDLGEYFGFGSKAQTGGVQLWLRCLAGDDAAFRLMERYNKRDVVLLEKIYNKLKPWIRNHPDLVKLVNKQVKREVVACPSCGSEHTQRRGRWATASSVSARHQCQDCGHWFKRPLPAEERPRKAKGK